MLKTKRDVSHARSLETDYPVAIESPDHLNPWGTRRDLSRQLRFESKLYRYMTARGNTKIMDLGCSGGAFIANMHDLGFTAIGIEGSDFSKLHRRGPWAYLSDFVLFTADITKPFNVYIGVNKPIIKFDIITSFEVLEHLTEEQVESLFLNIENHSHEHTRLIFSISTDDDFVNGVNLHQTVAPKEWWIKKFKELGWEPATLSMKFFNGQYLRGKKFNAPSSFELVLKRYIDKTDIDLHLSMLDRLLDANSGSRLQRLLHKMARGDTTYNTY